MSEKRQPKEGKTEKAPGRGLDPLRLLILHLMVVIAILWGMFGFVLGGMYAPNNDMKPNIKSGDLLFYYRLQDSFKAGDVVVLRKNGTDYIGRIAAVGGDTVEITDNEELLINGNVVSETNIYSSTPRYEGFVEYPLVLPEGSCFVLCDDRDGAEDSRYYGTVDVSELKGLVIFLLRRNGL